MKDTVDRLGVFGIGNIIMGDDGIGVELLRAISSIDFGPNVDLVEFGVGGMSLLYSIEKYSSVLIVDAVEFGRESAFRRAFSPEEVKEIDLKRPESLHQCDHLQVLELAKRMGKEFHEVRIFGIQPHKVGFDKPLSNELKGHFDDMVAELEMLIKEMGDRL